MRNVLRWAAVTVLAALLFGAMIFFGMGLRGIPCS